MFYTIQTRDPSGILHYQSSDISGWSVNRSRALTYGSEAATRTRAALTSKFEPRTVFVVSHDGASIHQAPTVVVAGYHSGKEVPINGNA